MAADALFDQAASVLIDRGIDGGIDCAIVLGTGLGRIVEDIVDPVSIPFAETVRDDCIRCSALFRGGAGGLRRSG